MHINPRHHGYLYISYYCPSVCTKTCVPSIALKMRPYLVGGGTVAASQSTALLSLGDSKDGSLVSMFGSDALQSLAWARK
jgi:hypothetical protein